MANPHPWPDLLDEHRSIVDLFEDMLESSTQTSEQLNARAQQLRDEAARTEVPGHREAALALADRYQQAAAARPVAR
jgi:hypothetical protein